METESRLEGAKGWGGGGRRMGRYCLTGSETIWDDENTSEDEHW